MLTVAFVGADGAGKSTVTARLLEELPVPARRMYCGANPEAATHALPTTRLARRVRAATGRTRRAGGPPALPSSTSTTTGSARRGPVRRALRGLRSGARVGNQIGEEAYQQAIGRWHGLRGRVVLCDRFPMADQHAHDLTARPGLSRSRRLHGAFLRRWLVTPGLVVVLDADPAVLHARKGEGTLAELASRRAEYLAYASTVERSVVVDASQPLDTVVASVLAAVVEAVGRTP